MTDQTTVNPAARNHPNCCGVTERWLTREARSTLTAAVEGQDDGVPYIDIGHGRADGLHNAGAFVPAYQGKWYAESRKTWSQIGMAQAHARDLDQPSSLRIGSSSTSSKRERGSRISQERCLGLHYVR